MDFSLYRIGSLIVLIVLAVLVRAAVMRWGQKLLGLERAGAPPPNRRSARVYRLGRPGGRKRGRG